MKERIKSLLLICPLLLCACGNMGEIPASLAEVTAVEVREESLRENGVEPDIGQESFPADGDAKTDSADLGQNSAGQGEAGQNPMGQETAGQEAAGQNPAGQGAAGQNSAGQGAAGQNPPGQEDGADGSPESQAGTSQSKEETGPEEIRITVSAAGDVTLGNYIGQGYEISFRQTYDKGVGDSYFFENVADIFSEDDLTLVNLEGPLTRSGDFREGQTYCISGDPEYVNILTAGSVEAVSMANNHRLDYKEQGTSDTVEALEGAGILYAYDNNYCMYETEGIRIGIVSVNEVGQGAGVETYLQEGVEKLREEGADLVFACCHWGIEREYYPEDYQKSLGRKCIDWGYDLVIGHHPHVLQGIEEYQGKFIVYSLGNFCFGANRNPPDKDCMIFQQTFTFREGEKQEDRAVRVIPCSVSSVSGRNDYKPTPAEGEEFRRILDKINDCCSVFEVEFDDEGYLAGQE